MEPLHFCSNAAQAPDTSKGPIFNRVLAPSLHSVANWVLCHFIPSTPRGQSRFARPRTRCSVTSFLCTLGGGDLASLDHELGAPSLRSSLRSTAKWVLPHFAPSHPGGRPHFAQSLTIIRFPFNCTNVWDHAIPSLLISEIVLAIASDFDLQKKEGENSDCSTIGTFT